jgi:flagellar M-ring protein FliF
MNQTFNAIMKGFAERWSLLSFNQKIMLGTLVMALMFSTFFVFQKTNDDFDILYDNLSLPDAAAAVEKLKGLNEPYRIANGGHTILVPRAKKNELVLATATELTSENTINLAKVPPVLQGDIQKEWIKKLNTQEIVSILTSIQGIKNAQVIVSQPEHSVFTEEDQAATASVMLMVEPGFRLHDEQVKVIKNLVAHAVPGLKPDNVAIADNSGNPLVNATGIMASGQSEADMRQKLFEDKVAKKVLSILTPVVGKENAVVSVSAMLNFDQAESEINRVIPSGGADGSPTGLAVSQQTDNEEYAGGNKPATESGTPGVQSNATPQYSGESDKNKNNNYKHSKTTTNFTNSEEHKKVIYAPGAVERLTVAVVLNKVLTGKETEEITSLVENAAGVDRSRGDSVDIKGFQFSAPLVDKEKELSKVAQDTQQQNFYLQLASVAAMVILGAAALFIFYSLFKKPAEGEIVEEDGEEYAYLPADSGPPLLESELSALEVKLDPEMEHMKSSINTLVSTDPQEAARVLITYMKEM